jgi:hypothetical protein
MVGAIQGIVAMRVRESDLVEIGARRRLFGDRYTKIVP